MSGVLQELATKGLIVKVIACGGGSSSFNICNDNAGDCADPIMEKVVTKSRVIRNLTSSNLFEHELLSCCTAWAHIGCAMWLPFEWSGDQSACR